MITWLPPPPRPATRVGAGLVRLRRRSRRSRLLIGAALCLLPAAAIAGPGETGSAAGSPPFQVAFVRHGADPIAGSAALDPLVGRLRSETGRVQARANGRYQVELAPGRSLWLTYRGIVARSGTLGEVDQQQHTPGLAFSQQLGPRLEARAGFEWTAKISDPDLSLHAANDRFFTELQTKMPIFGSPSLRYEFLRSDSVGDSGVPGDLHRISLNDDLLLGSIAPDLNLRLLPLLEGGMAETLRGESLYDFQRVGLGAVLAAPSGSSLSARVAFDWLHYYEGPDSQPGDRSDHVTRLAARLRIPFLDRFALFTDLSWRQDISTVAEADARTLRAGAGLEFRF